MLVCRNCWAGDILSCLSRCFSATQRAHVCHDLGREIIHELLCWYCSLLTFCGSSRKYTDSQGKHRSQHDHNFISEATVHWLSIKGRDALRGDRTPASFEGHAITGIILNALRLLSQANPYFKAAEELKTMESEVASSDEVGARRTQRVLPACRLARILCNESSDPPRNRAACGGVQWLDGDAFVEGNGVLVLRFAVVRLSLQHMVLSC